VSLPVLSLSDQRLSAKASSEGWRLCLRPNKIMDAHDQDTSSHSVPPHASTSNSQMVSRIHHSIMKDHPVYQIVSDISKGVQTHSRIASFCEHFSFVSCMEPNRVDEALLDVDWVNATHEELNNFTQK
jgi:hypothetical protein